jgi:hypothetical protein
VRYRGVFGATAGGGAIVEGVGAVAAPTGGDNQGTLGPGGADRPHENVPAQTGPGEVPTVADGDLSEFGGPTWLQKARGRAGARGLLALAKPLNRNSKNAMVGLGLILRSSCQALRNAFLICRGLREEGQ